LPDATETVRSEEAGVSAVTFLLPIRVWLRSGCRKIRVVVSVKALDSQIPSGRGHLDNISLFSKKKENNISRFGLVGRITYFR